ncbi:murein hydrolase activator EnvC family protein [Methylophaga sp. OBS3]|uniref:murein hydrolase activator EnvC family protein n=1 Tax=Methylophaga sp. OBS3 TaxID=2991934 RepID=UPI002258BDE8|nr:peptidoglycan DD-metalloendopeptidase family protein [Methylophaga sp. OBS3]MCX4189727.1 peptidoglycan DD-metalloendopeptidase family protein [Methylophaga sp. OBS3]
MPNYLLLLFGLIITTAVQADQPAKELNEVQSKINELNQSLSADKKSKEALYEQLRSQSLKVSEMSKALTTTQQNIKQQDQKIADLERELGEQKSQQQAQLQGLNKQLRAAYMHAQPGYLKILLNQHDPALISRQHTYYRYFHDARQAQIAEIDVLLNNISEEQKAVFAAQKEMAQMLTAQTAQQEKLTAEKKQREQTLAALDKKINSQASELADLQQQEQALQKLLASLNKKSVAKPPVTKQQKPLANFSGLTGKLQWPLRGKLLARYGESRNLGKLRWKGIMIAANTGETVRASAAGRVVFADWMKGFGLLIIVDHGGQFMSLYGNNDSLLKSVGDIVDAGETIAQSGNQGVRQMAGLYFEVRHKGSPTDPLKWLQKQS